MSNANLPPAGDHARDDPSDKEAMKVEGSPEVAPLPLERALSREKDIEYLKENYNPEPDPDRGHPLHPDKAQPSPDQPAITKDGDSLHGFHGG